MNFGRGSISMARMVASAAILPEFRHVLNGVENAHSLVVNPHKWLFTPIDCSVLYTNRPDVLRQALSLIPEYLRTGQDDSVVNSMDYGVPLGRRFRSLKLWFVMRYFGREGSAGILRDHISWARNWHSRSTLILCSSLLLRIHSH